MFVDLYEYNLPVLSTNLTEIVFELSQNYNGVFSIKNTGGSILVGSIYCGSSIISFCPTSWESNFITIEYTINVEGLKDYTKNHILIENFAVIKSNGGEKIIPITINIISDLKFDSLNHFYNYYHEYPSDACDIFLTEKFKQWLNKNNFNFYNIYNQLLIDENKERALDNFFRIVFNKPSVDICIDDNNIEYYIKYAQKGEIVGQIKVRKTDFGYIFCQIIKPSDNGWLHLNKQQIVNSDFDKDGEAVVTYFINQDKIIEKKVSDKLLFKTDMSVKEVLFTITKQPVLSIWLSKESFFNNDMGEVLIENNSGRVVEISVLTKDSFIKFEAKKYYIDSFSKIPFHIKYMPKTLSLFNLSKNKQVQLSEITIRTTIDKNVIRKRLKVIIVNN